MKVTEKIQLLFQVGRFFIFQGKNNFILPPPHNLKNPKFMTGRQAADMIPDGACVLSNGIAANARCRELFCITRYATGFLYPVFPKTSHGYLWQAREPEAGCSAHWKKWASRI